MSKVRQANILEVKLPAGGNIPLKRDMIRGFVAGLHHGIATASAQGLSGYEAGTIRGQKYHRIGYLLGLSNAA